MAALTAAAAGAAIGLGLFMVVVALVGAAPTTRLSDMLGSERHRGPMRRLARIDRPQLRIALAVVGAAAGLVLTRWPVLVLIGAALGFTAPSLVGERRRREVGFARAEAVASFVESLHDLLIGGAAPALETAVARAADHPPDPIAPEVRQLVVIMRHYDFETGLRWFVDQIADPAVDLVAASLILAQRYRAEQLATTLEAASDAARADIAQRRRVAAEQQSLDTSARILVVVCTAWAVGFTLFSNYMQPLGTATGQLVLLLVAALFTAGAVGMIRLARLEPRTRIFNSREPT